jgi:hypothetical protein
MGNIIDHLTTLGALTLFEYEHPNALFGYGLVHCGVAWPESYDVTLDAAGDAAASATVGYLRLRHGHFRAEVAERDGEIVFEAWPSGDGMFDDDERFRHLEAAVLCLDAWRRARGLPVPPICPAVEAAQRIAAACADAIASERARGVSDGAISAALELALRASRSSEKTDDAPATSSQD